MDTKGEGCRQRDAVPEGGGPLRYLAAVALALPVGGVALFELAYLYFGLTGAEPAAAFKLVALLAALGLAVGWSLRGARQPAEVVLRGSRLGVAVATLLPFVTLAVLVLWQRSEGRPDLGMGGLMLFGLPVIATGVALVLALFFALCWHFSARRLRR